MTNLKDNSNPEILAFSQDWMISTTGNDCNRLKSPHTYWQFINWIWEVFVTRALQRFFVILNTICGLIQILIFLIFKPFLYWLYPVPIFVFFVMGYYMKFESNLKRYDGALIYTAIWFVTNLGSFAFFGHIYFKDPVNMMVVETILSEMWLITCFNFHLFGNMVADIRGVSWTCHSLYLCLSRNSCFFAGLKNNIEEDESVSCDLQTKVLMRTFIYYCSGLIGGFKIESRFAQSLVPKGSDLPWNERRASSIRRICDCYQEQCAAPDLYALWSFADGPCYVHWWFRDFHPIRSGTLLHYQSCISVEHHLDS